MTEFFIALGSIFVVVILLSLLRRRTPAIQSPTLGLLDLTNGVAAAEKAADRAAIEPFFSVILDTTTEIPVCNVLFLYCEFEPDGSISGSGYGLREIIRDSGAVVAVTASANKSDNIIAAGKKKAYGLANLVLTLDRRGDVFPKFFQQLFALMKKGVSMPVAWVKIAPQIPGREHPDCPGAIFLCEAGQLAFK